MSADLSDEQATDELTWRPLRRTDTAALTQLMAAAEEVDVTEERYDEEDVVEHYFSGLVDLDADTRLVWRGDELIGYAEVWGQRHVREVHTVWLGGTVHPDHRRCGLGRELLRWEFGRAEELHAQRHPSVPANLLCTASEANVGLAALARSEGLQEIRFWFEMKRPLDTDAPLPAVQPVPGVRIETFDSSRDDDLRHVHNATFNGHFGTTERDSEEWKNYFTGARAFRPDLSLLAVEDDGDAIAGYLLAYVYDADMLATGRREVYIGQLGTMPSFRGRGIGTALMAAGLATWSAAGQQEANLGVDAANETGALGLYERAGFTVHKRSTSWGRTVAAQP